MPAGVRGRVVSGQAGKCDGMKPEDYSDSAVNPNFSQDPSNLRPKDPNHPMDDPTLAPPKGL